MGSAYGVLTHLQKIQRQTLDLNIGTWYNTEPEIREAAVLLDRTFELLEWDGRIVVVPYGNQHGRTNIDIAIRELLGSPKRKETDINPQTEYKIIDKLYKPRSRQPQPREV